MTKNNHKQLLYAAALIDDLSKAVDIYCHFCGNNFPQF